MEINTTAYQFAEAPPIAEDQCVCGIVGDRLNAITNSIRWQAKIEWLPVRHEEAAAFAAAEAHLTGSAQYLSNPRWRHE